MVQFLLTFLIIIFLEFKELMKPESHNNADAMKLFMK